MTKLRSLLLMGVGISSLGLSTALTPNVAAQPVPTPVASDTIWEVQLSDGSSVIGEVLESSAAVVVLQSPAGLRLELPRDRIRALRPFRGVIRDGVAWREDTNTTRLFFGPTGRTTRRGEGYVAAFQLVLPFASYGVTDNLTIAGGTPLLPEVIGEVFYLAPKVGIYQTPDLALSAGVLAFFSSWDDFDSAGILYGVGTYGGSDRAVTVGVGWPFASGDMADRPVAMGGLESRLSRRIKLVSENYLIALEDDQGSGRTTTDVVGVVTGGVRFIGETLSADLGLGFGLADDGSFCCIPMVNFVYHIGGGR